MQHGSRSDFRRITFQSALKIRPTGYRTREETISHTLFSPIGMGGLRCAAMVEFFHHCCVERSSCMILPTWKAWKQHAGNPSGIAENPKSVEGEICESSKLRLPRYCGREVIVCSRCPPYAVDRLVVLNGCITVPL